MPDHPTAHAEPSSRPGRDVFAPPRRRVALHWKIFIGLLIGAVAGVVAKSVFPAEPDGRPHAAITAIVTYAAEPAGQIFLRLLFMIVVPLVLSALILGVAGIGDFRSLGRVGLRTLVFTVLFSAASVVIGITLVNTIRPGAGLAADERARLQQIYGLEAESVVGQARAGKSTRDALLDIIPKNPLREIVGAVDGSAPGGGMLAVMFFALFFGVGVLLAGERAAPLVSVLQSVFDVSMVLIGLAMRFAPVGVAGLMFSLTAVLGVDVLRVLLLFMLTALAGLAIQMFGVYPLVLLAFTRMSPARFFARVSEVMLTAFATSSSNATLPTALRVAERNLGLRREIGHFVLTVGATANQNGTALYEGVVILFLAQAFGVELTLAQQLTVALTCVLAGIGTAGVPSGALPFIALVLATVGVPPEAIGIIVGVDRVLDMCRTVVNVVGDVTIATCVNHWEVGAAQRQPAIA
ncbi:MAG: dicarboxylate/amino acid:cation symporter [Phycisphaerae bacterium]